jgi:mRNA interferase MazF
MVAPITSTIYGAPSEVAVGVAEGLKHESAVNLDHVQTVEQSRLTGRLGHLGPAKLREVCRALAIAINNKPIVPAIAALTSPLTNAIHATHVATTIAVPNRAQHH